MTSFKALEIHHSRHRPSHHHSNTKMEEAPAGSKSPKIGQENNHKWIGLAIVGTTIGGTIALTAPFVLQHLRSPLPYMATPKSKVKRALEFICARQQRKLANNTAAASISLQQPLTRQQQQLKKGPRHFVDLGSGDGEAVYQAVQVKIPHHQSHENTPPNFYYTTATGIELNFTLWALAQFRRNLFWGRHGRQHSSFLWGDMFAHDLRGTDTVIIFGVAPLMAKLSRKLASETQPGTYVLAYRFPIPLASTSVSALASDHNGDTTTGKVAMHESIDGRGTDDHATTNPSIEGTTTIKKDMLHGDDTTNGKGEFHNNADNSNNNDNDSIVKEKDTEQNDDMLLHAELIYDQEEMRIYQCLGRPPPAPS